MQQKALLRISSDPAWIAAIITVFISIWIIVTDDLINSDGVLYIEVAAKIIQGEWAAAIQQYNWPFYSLLIATVSKISFLPLESAAYVVDVLVQVLLTFMFVRCAQALGGNSRVALFAAILIVTNVTMNGYRDQIIRDFGYWAFFFTALYLFLQYQNYKIPKYAIGFSLSMIVATLFRIEGVVFLLGAPLLVLFSNHEHKKNIYSLWLLWSPIILLLVICIVYIGVGGDMPTSMGRMTDPIFYLQDAYKNMVMGIAEKGSLLEETVLKDGARDMGTESMFAILFMMLIAKIISASGVIPAFFYVTNSLSENIRTTVTNKKLLNGFLLINLFVLIVFLLSHSFLSPRYTMTMALLITLPAAFSLSAFMEKQAHTTKWKQRGKLLIIVMLVYMFLDGITSFGASKSYIKEAGQWLGQTISKQESLAASDRSLYYYANKSVNINVISILAYDLRASKAPSIVRDNYDYAAIEVSRKQKDYEKVLVEWAGSEPVYRTHNERGDKVLIFKLK